jgi:hypothetical protein
VCSAGICQGTPNPVCVCGDANDDGFITATDALIALRAATGSTTCILARCDVNASGQVTATDALVLLRRSVDDTVVLDCSAVAFRATTTSLPTSTTTLFDAVTTTLISFH